ncbi:hypothetical protein H2200_006997 [Cladophialophora chaetospira]|uniref:Uncharacterized protein n=1 Tax=Cladophialophora chaetospira TaxID=386627 RepID=A0AA39CI73_9EURO|nr:hypothetical protein H2200_006997 [Cladophialophora chaetospira]
MAKTTRTQRRYRRAMAAALEIEESRSADQHQSHRLQAVGEKRQLQSVGKVEHGQRSKEEGAKDTTIDHPENEDFPLPIQPATDAEKAEVVTQYAELFCSHIDMKFADTSNRVELLNRQVMETVRRSKCTNVRKFHDFYDQWYPKRLKDTPDMMNEVGLELNEFEIVQDWWWEHCIELPTQSGRRGFVVDVFGRLKEELDVLRMYETIDALFEEYKHASAKAC